MRPRPSGPAGRLIGRALAAGVVATVALPALAPARTGSIGTKPDQCGGTVNSKPCKREMSGGTNRIPAILVNTSTAAPAPALVTRVEYIDAARTDAARGRGAIRFLAVSRGGLVTALGKSFPGELYDPEETSTIGYYKSVPAGNFPISQGGHIGFWQNRDIVPHPPSSYYVYDGRSYPKYCSASSGPVWGQMETGLPAPGARFESEFDCDGDYQFWGELDLATRLVIKKAVEGRYYTVYTVHFETESGTIIPTDADRRSINLVGNDRSAVINNCSGNPITHPVSVGDGAYAFCVAAGRNSIVNVRASNVDAGSGVAPAAVDVPVEPRARGSIDGAPRTSGRTVRVPVSCSKSRGCRVRAGLTVARTERRGSRAERRVISLGSETTTLDKGQRRTVTVTLNRAGRRLLRRTDSLTATLAVTSSTDGKHTPSFARVTFKSGHS